MAKRRALPDASPSLAAAFCVAKALRRLSHTSDISLRPIRAEDSRGNLGASFACDELKSLRGSSRE